MDVMATKIMVLAVVGLIIICTLYGEFGLRRRTNRAHRERNSTTVWRRDETFRPAEHQKTTRR